MKVVLVKLVGDMDHKIRKKVGHHNIVVIENNPLENTVLAYIVRSKR